MEMILAKKFEGELWIKASHHDQAVKQAIETERETCAKVCDDWTRTPETTGMELTLCAAAIRARGQE
jgi:hypothetical protein